MTALTQRRRVENLGRAAVDEPSAMMSMPMLSERTTTARAAAALRDVKMPTLSAIEKTLP
jgi:hypothetical protein